MVIEEFFPGCDNKNVIVVSLPGVALPLENATRILFTFSPTSGAADIDLDSATNPADVTWTAAGVITVAVGAILTEGDYWTTIKAFDSGGAPGSLIVRASRNDLLFTGYPTGLQ